MDSKDFVTHLSTRADCLLLKLVQLPCVVTSLTAPGRAEVLRGAPGAAPQLLHSLTSVYNITGIAVKSITVQTNIVETFY